MKRIKKEKLVTDVMLFLPIFWIGAIGEYPWGRKWTAKVLWLFFYHLLLIAIGLYILLN